MMGEAPPAFDLLYWNGDGTNLPAAMSVEYLRGLCQQDLFATKGFRVAGEVVTLADVTVPVCAIACETDHIAAWKSSYRGVQKMGSKDKTFILSESGHIAGIVNPPSRKKYGHWTNPDLHLSPRNGRRRPTSTRDPGGPNGSGGCRPSRARWCPRESPAMPSTRFLRPRPALMWWPGPAFDSVGV